MMKLKPKIQKAVDEEDDEALHGYAGTDGFWYDLTEGGYFTPKDVLADKKDLKRVNEALKVMKELEAVYNKVRTDY